jgi:7,8-dihydropterin-6-yl-methyl-4-(beta-D-ribofuranosyl)aminobenzene 5'-phosphate synthase
MKLTVLLDNNTLIDRYFLGEPGVSYFLQDGDRNVLFDVGYSDAFIRNAHRMADVDLLDVDSLVLSHGHLDHTWGLVPLLQLYTEAVVEERRHKKPEFVAHPAVFQTKALGGLSEIGSIVPQEKLSGFFDLRLSRDPVWLTERLVFLGEIERTNDFEAKDAIGKVIYGRLEEDDYLIDDSALAYKSPQGLVIVTGCSHAGICNIVEQAKRVCEDERVVDVVGGFHLLDPSEEQLQGTLDYMRDLQPGALHACHCTDLASKIALAGVANLKELGVGTVLEYD